LTKKWNEELLLGTTSITEAVHVSEIGVFEGVGEKRKVVHVCAW
jgi:hypothetical protein